MERRTSTMWIVKTPRPTNNIKSKCCKKDLLKYFSNTIKNYRELTINWNSLLKMNNRLLMTLILLSLSKNSLLEIAKLISDFITEVL